ncbi:N-acetylglucosamine kinase [Urechidicola croceus]|uniref:N-acetylglucosamine kinase n=1 Tax=Urechidicola croceus TaxID=1850246 RepID=A0A1D8P6W6_9FLAO|nr:N-acetylglucosamine kinase [Urechidicola croceus]AOW20314.1 N-acetylglucosamine kinase [Urechidicola croceus]
MILIADGGSTKCDWILLSIDGEVSLKTRTSGLNPAVFSSEILEKRLTENIDLKECKDKVTEVFFYGAGCGTERPRLALQQLFQSYFVNAIVDVKEDTYAAAFAATTEPGIICILGTGSNSSYFDGIDVHTTVPSLGYVLMDEASGNYFGKKLIRDYFYKKMPENLRQEFASKFDLDADNIKANVYKKENPNAYLATFAEFIFRNERNEYFNYVLKKGIKDFFKNRIRVYDNYQDVPVHFVGSIAYFSSDIIHKVAKKNNIKIGNIVRRPIDGLIEYHKNKLKVT